MARVPILNPNVDSISSSHYPGAQGSPSSSSSHSRSEMNNNTIAEQVINSPAYRSAHQILSQESDKSWLQRLEMIPYSVSDASVTFLDDWGLSNNFNDKQDANYLYCMEQISALMAEYQSWKNSLPVNQVQQLSDAGINSAITGQGVSGSSIPNVGVSANPSSLQSTNVGDFILNGASFILDSVNGLASVAQSFRSLGLQRDQQLFDFHKYLRENGISMKSDKKYRSLADLFNGLHRGDPIVFSDPKGNNIRTNSIVEKLLTNDNFAPLLKRWYDETDDSGFNIHTEFGGQFGTELQVDNPTFIGVDAITDAEYQSFLVDTKRAYLNNKLSILQGQNTVDLQEKENAIKAIDTELFDLQLEQMKIKINLINDLKSSNSLEDKLLLQKILLGYNETDQSILSTDLDFMKTEKELGIVGSIIGLLK